LEAHGRGHYVAWDEPCRDFARELRERIPNRKLAAGYPHAHAEGKVSHRDVLAKYGEEKASRGRPIHRQQVIECSSLPVGGWRQAHANEPEQRHGQPGAHTCAAPCMPRGPRSPALRAVARFGAAARRGNVPETPWHRPVCSHPHSSPRCGLTAPRRRSRILGWCALVTSRQEWFVASVCTTLTHEQLCNKVLQ